MSAVLLEVLGWAGSALLILSLLQKSMLRLRILNLTASAALVAYNAVLGVWPMVAMNGAVVLINLFHISRLKREHATPTTDANPPKG